MAKRSMLEREQKRAKLVERYKQRRIELKGMMKASHDVDEVMKLHEKLMKLPLNSSPVRHSTRCMQCGRSHAVYRKFGLCRICLRKQLMTGNVTGGRKSSW